MIFPRLSLFVSVLAGAVFLTSGCAVHAPVSERIVFESPPPSSAEPASAGSSAASASARDSLRPADARPADAAPGASIEFGLSITAGPTSTRPIIRDQSAPDEPETAVNPYRMGAGGYFGATNRDKTFAGAFSLGYAMFGADITTRLMPKTYATAAVGLGGGQVILQRRVLNRQHVAASAGMFTRADVLYVEEEVGFAPVWEERFAYVSGVRSAFAFRESPYGGRAVHPTLSAGADVTTVRPVVTITLSTR